MSLTKNGLVIDCDECQFNANRDDHGFEVIVPLIDQQSGLSGLARLHCEISAGIHHIKIVDWRDAERVSLQPDQATTERLQSALEFIADRRVCGNQKICPEEVINIVELFNRDFTQH